MAGFDIVGHMILSCDHGFVYIHAAVMTFFKVSISMLLISLLCTVLEVYVAFGSGKKIEAFDLERWWAAKASFYAFSGNDPRISIF